jgi:hypothetical protein
MADRNAWSKRADAPPSSGWGKRGYVLPGNNWG